MQFIIFQRILLWVSSLHPCLARRFDMYNHAEPLFSCYVKVCIGENAANL